MEYVVEIVAKKAGNCAIEYHIGNTPHDKNWSICCVSEVRVRAKNGATSHTPWTFEYNW